MEEREVLAVSVVVANEEIEDQRIEQRSQIEYRRGGNRPQKSKDLFQARSAFSLVFAFRWDAQRLAEVFLVKSSDMTAVVAPIKTPQQQIVDVVNTSHVESRRLHSDAPGEREAERFVEHQTVVVRRRGLQYVSTRCGAKRQCDAVVDDSYWKLVLSASQGQAQAFCASQQGSATQFPQDPCQFFLVEFPRTFVRSNDPRALRQQAHGSGAITADPLEECEVVVFAHAENSGDQSAVASLGQHATEERYAGAVGIPLGA